jgi:hypothetical protein
VPDDGRSNDKEGRRHGGLLFHYFSWLETLLKVVLRLVPIVLTATMMATEIPAAIRPYSIAVAPERSVQNRTRCRYKRASCLSSPLHGRAQHASQEFRFSKFMRELKRQLHDNSRQFAQQ